MCQSLTRANMNMLKYCLPIVYSQHQKQM